MKFERAFDFWAEYVLFGALTFTFSVMDVVADEAGEFAAFLTLALLLPLLVIGLFVGLMLTAAAFALLLVTSPITFPLSVYLHRRKH